ncbi:MAG TPA: heme ABC transporter ATP-binding protein [Candidatus Atribacteria bacterium]|uniref:Sugar ABC transporter ATP-binding protein n=1 Tax=candidate division TA06 bacterium 34_109 TaxID=1635277 RepID=A0A101I0V4_UNCT6|nr:MAG: Sugar ABC transporter ATP-binding protein [candidate division TA06 bacterium 34_109]HBY57226.1 heme ABC transporter ATP-binding protein [Candidatus Atribacteria bacterium]
MVQEIILSLKEITKIFPGVIANDHISLDIFKGEIHSLLGENGAGKTTLMNILYGLYKPDKGEIIFKGEEVKIHSPRDAINLGIGMIHQRFMLIPRFTVFENIILGQPSEKPPLLEKEKLHEKILRVAERFNIKLDLDVPVENLSVGTQQKVEILKALYQGADLLILDEPTSVLTPQEAQNLFKDLLALKEQGCTIIFISHKLKEVMQISDRITVLRDGKVVGTKKKLETNFQELSKLMVGREISFTIKKKDVQPGREVLCLEDISMKNKKGLRLLKNISLSARSGEILGIAGVDGNGQRELADAICRLQKIDSGNIKMLGQEVSSSSPRRLYEQGLSYIPADRKRYGLILNFTIAENLILKDYYLPPFKRGLFLNVPYINDYSKKIIVAYDIKTPSHLVQASKLSGGNQQKVVLGRELSKCPKLLIVMEPTQGLDVGACEFVHNKLLDERDKGVAILLFSTDLDEIMSLSDRIAVIYEGEIMGEVDPRKADVGEIGLMMAGVKYLEKEVVDG